MGDRQLLAGCIGIIILLLVVVLAPVITKYDAKLFGPDPLLPPGSEGHFLGTNHLGQDMWSMIVYGTRTSLLVAVVSAFISGLLGIVIGGIAGFFGGWVDRVISEIINVFLMVPTLFLILLIISMFGSSIVNVMLVIGLTSWPSNAKLMRAQALSLRERTFVKSARAMGETRAQVLSKYIIPNGVFPVIANTTMSMANAILLEASLSFLGLGDPTVISWGQKVSLLLQVGIETECRVLPLWAHNALWHTLGGRYIFLHSFHLILLHTLTIHFDSLAYLLSLFSKHTK